MVSRSLVPLNRSNSPPRVERPRSGCRPGAIPGSRLRKIQQQLDQQPLPRPTIKVIPNSIGAADFSNSRIPIRNIDIRDLLQREPVELDLAQLTDQLRGKRVLVTGAGGSIGSELCRQLLRFDPSDLVLVDHRENSVFLIHEELRNREPRHSTELRPCVGDILDESRMRAIFSQHRPHYVYHAAAHKHVGLMEANPGEAIKNNVFGTKSGGRSIGRIQSRKVRADQHRQSASTQQA